MTSLLHELIATHATGRPGVALEDGGVWTSYRDLDRRATQVANHLIGAGLQSGSVVALRQPRLVNLIASLLGVLKAGAAYVIIDPATPAELAAERIFTARARLVLGSNRLPALPEHDGFDAVAFEDLHNTLETYSGKACFVGRRGTAPDGSGHCAVLTEEGRVSTVRHRDAVKLTRSLIKMYDLGSGDRFAHCQGTAFDVAIEESLAALAAGATVVLDQPDCGSADALRRVVRTRRITHLSTTPPVVEELADDLPTLSVLILGREVASSVLVAHWAFRVQALVSMKRAADRFPSFRIEQESGVASRPRLMFARAA